MSDQPNYLEQLQNADIDELADMIGDLLNNPITIEDAEHRLIAYSSHGDRTDQARWSTIMGRRVPEKVLTRLWKDGFFQQLLSDDHPVHIPAITDVGLGKRVAIAIRKGSDVLGYIWVQEVIQPVTQKGDEILRQAAKAAVPRLMQRQSKRKAEEQRRKDFFWELLLGNLASETAIRRKAENVQIELPSPFLITIIDAKEGQLDRLMYPLLMRDRLLWVKDGNQLILLLGHRFAGGKESSSLAQETEQFLAEALDKLEQHGDTGSIVAGYGQAFHVYADIGRSYRQALQVIQAKRLFGEETRQINGFHNLGIYRFLPQLKKWGEAEEYENQRIVQLKQYDRENQTNLLETLETFLDMAGKVNKTAQHLHIHINTLGYRLKRIEEIVSVDLDDQNQRTALYLDIKMNKLDKNCT